MHVENSNLKKQGLLEVQNPLSEIPKSESSENESFDYSIIRVYK